MTDPGEEDIRSVTDLKRHTRSGTPRREWTNRRGSNTGRTWSQTSKTSPTACGAERTGQSRS